MKYNELIESLLQQQSNFKGATVDSVTPLAGDASGREFFRVHLRSAPVQTAVLLIPGKTIGPVSSAGEEYLQDETYIHIGKFLWNADIPIPEIYAADGTMGAFLVEDIGDTPLWHITFGTKNSATENLKKLLGDDTTVTLYERAIDVIYDFQHVPQDEACIAFKRSLGLSELENESLRFVSFYAEPEKFKQSEIEVIRKALHELCQRVSNHPQVLIHRDYMPWNLHITPEGGIRVIDFQDACLGPATYDLVSLLHDRDSDLELSSGQLSDILSYYQQKMETGEEFRTHYFENILQRHFRLAGQFRRLTEKTGRQIYADWIPGCLERLGKTMALMPEWAEVLNILSQKSPHVQRGASSPWAF